MAAVAEDHHTAPKLRGAYLAAAAKITTFDSASCNLCFDVCDDEEEGLLVFGHMSPDTDAVGAAIVRAWELRAANNNLPICARPYINTDEMNRETRFVLDFFGIDAPPVISKIGDRQFAVVDTNNIKELTRDYTVEKMSSEKQLHSIIDHHRITGTLKSEAAIEWDNRPVSSTGLVLYQRAKITGLSIPGANCELNIAGLMLSTILSDTLVFRSPTTTQLDVEAANELGRLAGVDDIKVFGEAMLDAKSNITGYSALDLVMIDSKVADFFNNDGAKFNVRISVFETVHPKNVLDIGDEISKACDTQLHNDQEDADFFHAVLFFVIDIIEERAIFIPSSSTFGTDLILNGFPNAKRNNGNSYIELPGVVSRKKTIMPALIDAAVNTRMQ